MAIGWPSRILTTRLGMAEHGSVLDIANHNNATIRRATADNVRRVYDELWDKPGPSRISAQRAAKRGWVPPLAWDDDTIDDPAAVADLGEPDAPSPRGRLREHVVEDYLDTWDHHLGYLPAAATRLGLSEYALEQALRRSGLRVSRVAS